ncbi:hypothetical protein [Kitasatospora sp. NPDC050463]|uniref:hypothetical protein n=1 Tax=Kitasatospora sp. NPDC050463 TaxID=3155786 RepID=UPI00340BAB46
MRSTSRLSSPVPDCSSRTLTGPEAVLIVVIVLLAGALAAIGLPMYGVLEFTGALVYLACRTVKGLRGPHPASIDTI